MVAHDFSSSLFWVKSSVFKSINQSMDKQFSYIISIIIQNPSSHLSKIFYRLCSGSVFHYDMDVCKASLGSAFPLVKLQFFFLHCIEFQNERSNKMATRNMLYLYSHFVYEK